MASPFRRVLQDQKLFTAQAATGTSSLKMDTSDFRDVVIAFFTASSANLTVKIQGAIGETAPDFSAAASATNQWAYLQCVDLNTGLPITGSTGLVWAGTDAGYLVEVNVNAIDWMCLTVTARSAGSLTATATSATNL